MHSCKVLYCSLREESIVLQVMLQVNACNGPSALPSISLQWNFESLNQSNCTFPPLIVKSFSMLVRVSLTPGSLSLIPISRWIQKYFSGEVNNSTYRYLPIRLVILTSPVGSGIVTVLLLSIDPVILKHFLAMVGS